MCHSEKANANFRTKQSVPLIKREKYVLQKVLNDKLDYDNPIRFQIIILVVLCIEDFESPTNVLLLLFILRFTHPVWAAENQSISGGRRISGTEALSYLFVNHANK